LAIDQLNFTRMDYRYFGLRPDLHATFAKFLVRITTKLFTQLRQDVFPRVHKHESKHVFFEIWIERQRVTQEVIDARDRFDASEPAARNHERQKWRTFGTRAFGVRFFQMGD